MDPLMIFQAFFVIGILSALYKYNVWYRFCEYTFIAVSVAITVTVAWRTILNNAILPLLSGDLFLIFPIAVGLLYLTRISKRYGYLARISMGIMVGTTLGAAIRVMVQNQIIDQILPVISVNWLSIGNLGEFIGTFYAWIGLIAGLTYFLFTTTWIRGQSRRGYDLLARGGQIVMLMFIAAQFANTTMGRQSIFIERIYFLLQAFGLAK